MTFHRQRKPRSNWLEWFVPSFMIATAVLVIAGALLLLGAGVEVLRDPDGAARGLGGAVRAFLDGLHGG